MTDKLDNNPRYNKKNPYLEGGEDEDNLPYKRSKWFCESYPKKIRDNYKNKKRLLRCKKQLVQALKTGSGEECAKRRPNKLLIKKRKHKILKREVQAKHLRMEV